MGFGDPAGYGQSKTSTPPVVLLAGTGFVRAEKTFKYARLQIRGDSSSGIGNAQDVFVSRAAASHRHASTLWGVLDRVIQ